MSVTTSTVSGMLYLPSGSPAAHAEVTFTLVGLGVVGLSLVMPRTVSAVCDADGGLSVEVVPSPPGTYYDVSATAHGDWGSRPFFTERAVIPGTDCQLSQTLQLEPAPALDAAQQALLDLQAAMAQINAVIPLAAPQADGGTPSSIYSDIDTIDGGNP